MRPRRQRLKKRDVHTVDVTAFLSLMVILVPFLLVTAVFSRTSIIELQPVIDAGGSQSEQDPLQLQVTLRDAVIEVSHAGLTQPLQIGRSADNHAVGELATLAVELKKRHPQSLEAIILLEPQIPYDLLVQVLDALRVNLAQSAEGREEQTLFPQIALGTAP